MFGPALLTALVMALALPASSLAKDPLLSGYGGPGGGEQVLLGSHLTGGGGSGGSGGGSSAAAPSGGSTAAPGSLRAPTAASGPPSTASPTSTPATAAPAAKGGAKGGAKHAKGHAKRQAGSATAKPTTPAIAAPRQVAYPTRADDAGGFPLSAGELAVGALALLALGGLAAWLRRTAAHGGGPGAQASA